VKDILIALLIIAVVILVFGAVNQDQRIDFNYIAGTWHGASTFALAGIGAGVTLVAGLGVAAVARAHVLGARRKLEKEIEQVYLRLRAAEAASPAAAEASRGAVHVAPAVAAVPASVADLHAEVLPAAEDASAAHTQGQSSEVTVAAPEDAGQTADASGGSAGDAAGQR
jgi:uncharacterized integral membrane protein